MTTSDGTTATTNTNTTVSAKLTEELYNFLEDFRWQHRLTKTEVVVEALTGWANSKGYNPDTNNSGINETVTEN